MKYIDLHTHSTCSDGTFTPSELAAHAAEKGLAAFALTDHDTTDGLAEAAAAAAEYGVEFVPGIEFSTEYRDTTSILSAWTLILPRKSLLRSCVLSAQTAMSATKKCLLCSALWAVLLLQWRI